MKIQTGRGTIPLITLIAIWSISALTSLPGLAVSPILGDLTKIFPKATDLDIQMLTSLPSLLIIPFILLGGKLTEKVDFVRILKIGLWLFAASGILYLISNKMWQLIVVSALLGIGSGLIIPLSTGLISKYFVGTYRVKQFGLSSAITNFTLVIATAVTGYLAEVSWHLPFLVYLLPLISILLVGHLKESRSDAAVKPSSQSTAPSGQTAAVDTGGSKYGIHIKHLLQIMLFYGVTTFIVLAVIFNLSFLMEKHHFSSGNSGLMISLFFLAIMAPGFCLDKIVDELKERTKAYSLLSMAVGLALIWIAPIEWLIIPGCILVGLGYGVIQPMLYDKTTHTALPQKATMALAFVMMMNYLAILLYPFIIDFLQNLFHTQSQEFPFIFNLLITIATFFWAYLRRDTFLFNDQLK
ncbi:MFS transporter [Bacteroides thetaiotaomicron]|jgi:Cyanate permease|uniref:MFS transporter n=1 Tax=Bacteroides thetaiotaomicron TaxID=818 RepID=A0A1H7VNB1_BACT4|nr:MFS transporter [Bacteroides thetaiotaomicron]MCS3181502.1 MFS transporter [Bacteroides thetaiotaomicron]RHK31565.1 MFS transporter [Bacteroides thetaiotaomicron]RHL58541.1 MFS transporter [Bacteroides thetaiotaomicron]WOG43752.1 MFS transporter [Bacteroides thetaiotaomicron]SEM10335.1 Cyanate permease [Bacteroides thetaiotaomicron]